jgi:uncharacterized membrane protein
LKFPRVVERGMDRSRTVDVLGVALAVAAALGGVAVWNDLPATMAIHFDPGGSPDTFVPRAVGVFLLPTLVVVLVGALNVAARYDPPSAPRVLAVSKLWLAALLGYVQWFVVAWNLGYRLSVDLVLAPVLLSAVVLVLWSVAAQRRATAG